MRIEDIFEERIAVSRDENGFMEEEYRVISNHLLVNIRVESPFSQDEEDSVPTIFIYGISHAQISDYDWFIRDVFNEVKNSMVLKPYRFFKLQSADRRLAIKASKAIARKGINVRRMKNEEGLFYLIQTQDLNSM